MIAFMSSSSQNLTQKVFSSFFLLFLYLPTTGWAATFCGEVLDSYDFETGVFAGPDPDHLPTRINAYVDRRVQHEVLKGELTPDEARFFMQTAIGEMHLFQSIAENCKREPESGIRLIDRLIEPHMKPAHLHEEKTERGNQAAENFLPVLFKTCQEFWMETDSLNLCSLEVMQRHPDHPIAKDEALQVDIINGTMTGFEARARHGDGDTTYRITAEGTVTEFHEE